jgi:excisionase family DNA binding protein
MAGDLIYMDRNDLKEVIESILKQFVKDIASPANEPVEFLTRKEAAKILGVSLPTLHEWTKSGKVPGHRIGTRVRYKKSEIENSLLKIKTR